MSPAGVPGVVETVEAHGETTLVVDPARIVEACTHLRDAEGYNVLVDLCGGRLPRLGREAGRGLHRHPGGTRHPRARIAGLRARSGGEGEALRGRVPPAARRPTTPRALRVEARLDDGEEIDSVIGVWPAADWNEREAYDLFGIVFRGHPYLVRILMPEDWEGHPLRKDYPLGGEPVRFSGEA